MPRASKKAPKKCCSHEFSLKPCREHLKRPQNLTLSYCSKHGEQKSMCTGNSCDCFQAPTFNIDQSHASPTFILPSDSVYLANLGLLSYEERRHNQGTLS